MSSNLSLKYSRMFQTWIRNPKIHQLALFGQDMKHAEKIASHKNKTKKKSTCKRENRRILPEILPPPSRKGQFLRPSSILLFTTAGRVYLTMHNVFRCSTCWVLSPHVRKNARTSPSQNPPLYKIYESVHLPGKCFSFSH